MVAPPSAPRDPGTVIILTMPHDVDPEPSNGEGKGNGAQRIPEPAMPTHDQGAATP